MLKKLFILLLLIGLSTASFSQYKPVIFGFKVAPNIGWMKPDSEGYESDGITPGFSWGFISEFYLMENYAIITGFNVIYLNGKMTMPYSMSLENDSTLSSGTLNRKYKIQYIEIPLALKLQLEITEKFKLFGKIGLGTGFRLKAKSEDLFTAENGEQISSEEDIKDDISLMRSSLIIGIGTQYNFKGSSAIVVDITFNNGFVDILNGSNPAVQDLDHKATNSFVELSFGVVF